MAYANMTNPGRKSARVATASAPATCSTGGLSYLVFVLAVGFMAAVVFGLVA